MSDSCEIKNPLYSNYPQILQNENDNSPDKSVQQETSSPTNRSNGHNSSAKKSNELDSLPVRENVVKFREVDLPRINCPEKIVLCIDVSNEMETNTFKSRAGGNFEAIKVIKRALKMWLRAKSMIDYQHEFAIMLLHEEAIWLTDFTCDVDKLMTIIEDLTVFESTSFDIGSVFSRIAQEISPPAVEVSSALPPSFVLRVILIYGRSNGITKFENRDEYDKLRKSPYFFVDALYIHEEPSENNKCEDIFHTICELDEDGLSYIIEIYRNQTKVYDGMAQLLAHPLQRSLQQNAYYTIEIEDYTS